jgi:hypothetical protein
VDSAAVVAPAADTQDEGFASSSSIEQDQIFEVIRRKKRTSYQPLPHSQRNVYDDFKSNPIDASRKILEEKISMAPLESILWTISFLWVFFQLYDQSLLNNQVMAGKKKKGGHKIKKKKFAKTYINGIGWMSIIWFGILLVNVSIKKGQIEVNESSATSSADDIPIPDSPTREKRRPFFAYDGDKKSKICSSVNIESVNRIFGASRTSFR